MQNYQKKGEREMSNRREQDLFNYFISGMDKEMQAQLRFMYSRNSLYNEIERRQQIETLKKEITEDVLSRISIMFETGEALNKINALNKAIEQLGE